MKNIFASVLLLVSVAGSLTSCVDKSKLPAPPLAGSVPLITPVISSDPEKNHFDFTRTQVSDTRLATDVNITNRTRPVFEFSFELNNNRDKKVKTVEVYKSFLRGTTFGTRVLAGSYNSFPVTVSLNSQQALTGLQRVIAQAPALPYLLEVKGATAAAPNPILRNDAIVFTFEYVLEDDSRIILTPVTATAVGPSPGGVVPSSPTVQVLATTTQIRAPYAVVAVIR